MDITDISLGFIFKILILNEHNIMVLFEDGCLKLVDTNDMKIKTFNFPTNALIF